MRGGPCFISIEITEWRTYCNLQYTLSLKGLPSE